LVSTPLGYYSLVRHVYNACQDRIEGKDNITNQIIFIWFNWYVIVCEWVIFLAEYSQMPWEDSLIQNQWTYFFKRRKKKRMGVTGIRNDVSFIVVT